MKKAKLIVVVAHRESNFKIAAHLSINFKIKQLDNNEITLCYNTIRQLPMGIDLGQVK